jgi:hypothetical protein
MNTKLVALLVAAGLGFASHACAQPPLPYPDIVDASHASKDATDFFRVFFTAKSLHRPAEMMEQFARGSDQGGGYEWRPDAAFPMRRGIVALALDEHGQIMHFTAAYDSSLFDGPTYQALVLLAAEQ